MKRTTMFLPETLERDLQLRAKQEGRPMAALVREALAEYIARHQPVPGLPSFVAAFSSGRSDTAERHEDLLFRTLAPHNGMGSLSGPAPRAPRKRR